MILTHFDDKIYAILSTIGVTEQPYIPVREGANLDTFAVVSEDDVRKLVIKYKTAVLLTPYQPHWLNNTLLNYSHSLRTQSTFL